MTRKFKTKKGQSALSEKVDILAEGNKKAAKVPAASVSVAEEKRAAKPKVTAVKAKARYLRISPKKVRLVINLIRGQKVEEALVHLKFLNKRGAPFVLKLLNSAAANAEHNFKLKKEDLYIKEIVANEGPTLHRFQPVAFGRARPIRQRSTHLEVSLGLQEERVAKKAEPEKINKKKKEKTKAKKPVGQEKTKDRTNKKTKPVSIKDKKEVI